MSLRAWRTAHASVIGTSHLASGTECQDAARCAVVQDATGADVLIAAVSDGAGSAPRSSAGATLATDTFLDAMSDAIGKDTGGLAFLDRSYVEVWLAGLLVEISAMADQEGRAVGDYACTFLAAVVSDACACFLQVGDGAIVASRPGEAPQWIFWPQHGEFANSTFFVTQQGVADVLMFSTCTSVGRRGPRGAGRHIQRRAGETGPELRDQDGACSRAGPDLPLAGRHGTIGRGRAQRRPGRLSGIPTRQS